MINFKICKRCEHCNYLAPELDEDSGEVIVAPSVVCKLKGFDMLLMNEEPPEECPFLLDHILSMDTAPPELIDKLSGKVSLET